MSWLSELFSGGKDPSKEAMKYLGQIPGATQPYYQPYIDRGREAGSDLTGRYNELLNNPNDLYDKLSSGYKESPGYQTRLKDALQAVSNASAAGGMAGSPEHFQEAAGKAMDLRGQDFEDYLNHVLGLYGQGLSGEQGQEERGYNASTGYGNILGSNLAQEGGLAYQGQAGRNANQANLWSNIIKGGSMLLPGAYKGVEPYLNLLPNRSMG